MRFRYPIVLFLLLILGSVVIVPISASSGHGSGPPVNIPQPQVPPKNPPYWSKIREGEFQYNDLKLVINDSTALIFVNNSKFMEITNIRGVILDKRANFISIRGHLPSDLLNIYALEPIRITGHVVDLHVKIYLENISKIRGRLISGEKGDYRIIGVLKEFKKTDGIIELHGSLMISIVKKGYLSRPFARIPENIAEKTIDHLNSYIIIRKINKALFAENLTIKTPIRGKVIRESAGRLHISVSSDDHIRDAIIALELSEFTKAKIKDVLLDNMTPMVRVDDPDSLIEIPGSYMIVLSDSIPIMFVHLPHMSEHTLTIIFESLERAIIRYSILAGVAIPTALISILVYVSRKY